MSVFTNPRTAPPSRRQPTSVPSSTSRIAGSDGGPARDTGGAAPGERGRVLDCAEAARAAGEVVHRSGAAAPRRFRSDLGMARAADPRAGSARRSPATTRISGPIACITTSRRPCGVAGDVWRAAPRKPEAARPGVTAGPRNAWACTPSAVRRAWSTCCVCMPATTCCICGRSNGFERWSGPAKAGRYEDTAVVSGFSRTFGGSSCET